VALAKVRQSFNAGSALLDASSTRRSSPAISSADDLAAMETTFISIHSTHCDWQQLRITAANEHIGLDDEARILYSSDSIIDILGYTPDEVVNRSAWEFFIPEEVPYAREFQQKNVAQDKAAVLAYCRVKGRNGQWIGCECCFTIVYDVMIVCTSIYQANAKSQSKRQS